MRLSIQKFILFLVVALLASAADASVIRVNSVHGHEPLDHTSPAVESIAASDRLDAKPAPAVQGAGAIQLPSGFAQTELVRDLKKPTDMAFLPNGDILVTQKGEGTDIDAIAHVRLVRDGVLQAAPVLAISTNSLLDSGLLAIVVDPDFAENGWFYLWHATGETSRGWNGQSVMRLSRFTFDTAPGSTDPASEVTIFDGVPWSKAHAGGSLAFDEDGLLYLGTGDGADQRYPQNLSSVNGKVLRIRPTAAGHEIPEDNPFLDVENAAPSIYAVGLRNPFRMIRRPDNGTLLIADVGQSAWEEINLVAPRANYGWPEREGPCPPSERQPCERAPAEFTEPILTYAHPIDPEEGGAVTSLALAEAGPFPADYHGSLFFADLDQQYIARGVLNDDGSWRIEPFAENAGFLVDMVYRDEGLYVLNVNSGRIHLIYYNNSDNQPPVAQIEADAISGAAPLAVNFSAAGSSDPDDLFLRYEWNFGDGQTLVTEAPTASHTYLSDGTFTASVTVIDAREGASSPAEVALSVYSGLLPEIVLDNTTEPVRARYYGGDVWHYAATYPGDAADLDPQTPFTWRIDMQHNQHAHPTIASNKTLSDTFAIDSDNHGGDWNIWYRFYLTMKTESGQNVTVSKEIRPMHAALALDVAAVLDGQTVPLTSDSSNAVVRLNGGCQQRAQQRARHCRHGARAGSTAHAHIPKPRFTLRLLAD